MDKSAAVAAIKECIAHLEANGIHVASCVLFGSYASGTAHEYSDIDIAVISDDFASKGFMERITILSDAIYYTHAPIEATAFTPVEFETSNRPIAQFARKGEIIHAA